MSDDLQHVLRLLRAHTEGVLLCDQTPEPIRFVVSRSDHTPIFTLPRPLADAEEHLLCLPDDSFDLELRLLVTLAAMGTTREIDRDRHLAYHGRAAEGLWFGAAIEHAHAASGPVVDGTEVMTPSELAGAEPTLCRLLNTDRARLRAVTRLLTGVDVPEPLAVGVDSLGFDVRARLGVVRVEFPSPCPDESTARGVIVTLLERVVDA